ncbi:hypothetical protein CGLO_06420 [Colletotrichum gloeosporioides Cg-14]|uniref:Uncharacterized protein n=1 Tax=Colletotrichum gloeosporioides (strain Cg-14) TaxID=1237896 RepID=T0KP62_COLGC|nr:hypothetical protein CGLO_06420 [Colletotrichum gloeosporioides Cg-14]
MNVSPSQDSSGPIVRLELPNDWPEFEVKNEFSDTTETCFVRLAAQFAAGELDLSGYMDGVLSHLQKNGPRHKWDVPVKNRMANFMELDLFAGAVKRWFLEPSFVPLEKEDISRFKDLAILAWTVNDPGEFDRRYQQTGLDLNSLTPELADLLLVVCYCRRHTTLFAHFIKSFPGPPPQTTFDAVESHVLYNTRLDPNTTLFQHSPKAVTNSSDEITLWTEILNSHWLHDPIDGEKGHFLATQVGAMGIYTKETDDSAAMGTPKANAYLVALAQRGLCYDLPLAGRFLASCKSVAQAREFLGIFPPEKMKHGPEPSAYESGSMIVDIANSRQADGEVRSAIMELVLEEIGGMDVNATVPSNPWEYDMPGCPRSPHFNGLHVAASRGDRVFVELLIRHGARVEEKERVTGLTAAGFAMKEGHTDLARWLEGFNESS